jgi:hypothetical protein
VDTPSAPWPTLSWEIELRSVPIKGDWAIIPLLGLQELPGLEEEAWDDALWAGGLRVSPTSWQRRPWRMRGGRPPPRVRRSIPLQAFDLRDEPTTSIAMY